MLIHNNPFNLRCCSSNHWLGEDQPYRGFCTFDTLEHGIRAFLIVIRSYIVKHKLRRICDIINRFAPPCENHTLLYIMYVCGDDFHDDTEIDSFEKLCIIAQRMANYESGTYISLYTIFSVAKHYHIFDHVFKSSQNIKS